VFGRPAGAVAPVLEPDETEQGAWQACIDDALTESGAVDDEEVLDATRRLHAATDPDRAQAQQIDVETNYWVIGAFHFRVMFRQAPPFPDVASSWLGQPTTGETTEQPGISIRHAHGAIGVCPGPVTAPGRVPGALERSLNNLADGKEVRLRR
jgi:hypothetical protein